MKNILSLIIIALILLIVAAGFIVNKHLNNLDEIETNYKSFVGKQVIVANDTLTIVDYSLFTSQFVLNDKSSIAYDYVKKHVIYDTIK